MRSTTSTHTSTHTWTDSVNHYVRLNHAGSKRRHGRKLTGQIRAIITSVVLWCAVLCASANLLPVFGASTWIPVVLLGTTLGTLIAAMPGRTNTPLVQALLLALSQFVVGPVVCLPDTTVVRVIPTLETLSQGALSTLTSFKYVISLQPPLGTTGGAGMALWTLCLWIALLALTAARAQSRFTDLIACALVLVEVGLSAALGTSQGFWPVATGCILAVVLLVWASWHTGLLDTGGYISGTALLVVGVAAALVVGISMPSQRSVLRDYYNPPISPYDYSSPLSGLRAYIKNHKDDKLLSVTGLPSGTPVRLAVMDSFDGVVWNLSDSTDNGSSDYRQAGESLAPAEDAEATSTAHGEAEPFSATFTVRQGFDQVWLPLAGHPRTIVSKSSAGWSLYYNTDTFTALVPQKISAGLRYTITGTLASTPTAAEIKKSAGQATAQPTLTNIPKKLSELAQAWAGSSQADGASALALSNQLHNNGWFSHGLQGDYPSLPGHGSYRISSLLEGSSMVGDSEQYASAMALMARQLGLSSRVVLGFIPKDKAGNLNKERTTNANGTTNVTFTGNDIEAWVEINLNGYGWVSFYPTPEETKVPDKNQNTTPPDPQTLVRQPSVPLKDPIREEQNAAGTSLDSGTDAETATDSAWAQALQILGTIGLYGSPLWILLVLAGAVLMLKWLTARRWRTTGSSQQRVERGWDHLVLSAHDFGVHASGTRREQSRTIEHELDLAPGTLEEVSSEADSASFSSTPPTLSAAMTYWNTVKDFEKEQLARRGLWKRWKARLNLKGLMSLHAHNVSSHNHPFRTRVSVWWSKIMHTKTHPQRKGVQ